MVCRERAGYEAFEAAVVFDHTVDAFDWVASGVVGCPVGGAVGVALVVVELVDLYGDHAVAAVLGVGYGGGGQVGSLFGAVGPDSSEVLFRRRWQRIGSSRSTSPDRSRVSASRGVRVRRKSPPGVGMMRVTRHVSDPLDGASPRWAVAARAM